MKSTVGEHVDRHGATGYGTLVEGFHCGNSTNLPNSARLKAWQLPWRG